MISERDDIIAALKVEIETLEDSVAQISAEMAGKSKQLVAIQDSYKSLSDSHEALLSKHDGLGVEDQQKASKI